MNQVPSFIHRLSKLFVWTIPNKNKIIYLTFDDGPNPEVTPLVLDILDQYDATATFFCVGENVERYPDLFNEIKNRGHNVGNHTYNHLKGFQTDTKTYIENVEKADKLVKSKLFRPPYGRIKWRQARKLSKKYQVIMWSLLTYDYDSSVDVAEIVDEVQKKSKSGDIVLFHDSLKAKKNVLEALPLVLQFWKAEGFKVEKISL